MDPEMGMVKVDTSRVEEVEDNYRRQNGVDIDGGEKKDQSKVYKGYGLVEDKSTWVRLKPTNKKLQWAELSFNPVVTGISLSIVLAFIIWAMVLPEQASTEFKEWKSWIGLNFTWFYIGSTDIWAIFVIFVYLSKYGDMVLGKEGDVPEYNDATWFSMLFACGVSTGLFFYGVAEPVFHYIGPNRFTMDSSLPDNRLAQEAINITLYHWGLHGWVVYTIVGLLLAVMSHRAGLPLTIKSCFYPLIGDKVFGWLGDLLDIISVIATLFGVCTSLGLGTIQINQGLNLISDDIPVNTKSQIIIIWSITAVATVSVLTGVKYGIRRLSEFCFICGLCLMLSVLFMDSTVFLLNLYVQSMGYYFQNLIQIGFHSDAFEQLGPSDGGSDRGRFLPDGVDTTDGPANWMNLWTIFYWGWWIAWCPFVGMFIAKISVGRTVRQFITGTMAAPVVYVFMWMIIFGGAGLRMEREAAGNNLCCHNFNMTTVINMAAETPDKIISFDDDLCKKGDCNDCSTRTLQPHIDEQWKYSDWKNETDMFHKPDWWGVTTTSRNFTRLSCRKTEEMWFDLMMSYGDLGGFLSIFSLISLILYFVTSSDSGSLIIDCLASNGHPEPPRLQRLVWALIEGLTATALLVAGGEKGTALYGLQAMSIATGLIYTVLMCVACVALWRALQVEGGDVDPRAPSFSMSVLDPFFTDPFKEVPTKFNSTFKLLLKFLGNLVISPYTVGRSAGRLWGSKTQTTTMISLSLLLFLFVLLHILELAASNCWALAWVAYIAHGGVMTGIRRGVRTELNIPGHPLEDLFVCLLLYPSVALQLDQATSEKKSGTNRVSNQHKTGINNQFKENIGIGAENQGFSKAEGAQNM